MNQTSEFVISSEKGQLIRQNAPLIERLFNVGLEFTTDFHTAQRTGSEWVNIAGSQQDRQKAEEFTKGISNPETRFHFAIPEDLGTHFSWNKEELLWNIQRESCAILQRNNQRSLYIQGSEIAVAKAISLLEDNATAARKNQHFQSYLPYQQNGDYFPNPVHPRSNGYSDYYYPDIVAKGGAIAPAPRAATPKHTTDQYLMARGSSPLPRKDIQLRDFAQKLGYSNEEINTAIAKCNSVVNENSLLQQLTTLFPRRFPVGAAQSNSSTIVKDSAEPIANGPLEARPSPESLQQKNAAPSNSKLRHIVIDGSNVAMSHGNGDVFSCKGIQICVDYFKKRNHTEITVFVPQWRKEASKPDRPIVDQQVLLDLEKERILVFTPSRRVNGRRVVCYDDRYIVKFAADNDGIMVSNDNFRDLEKENSEWKRVIEQRLLMYTFVKDCFMPPDDPLGRHGPKLDDFLKKGTVVQPRLCPYKKKCTYGQKCKFFHPERAQADGETQSNYNASNNENTRKNVSPTGMSGHQSRQQELMQKSVSSAPNKKYLEIQRILESIFPNREDAIKAVMSANPHETDVAKLVELML